MTKQKRNLHQNPTDKMLGSTEDGCFTKSMVVEMVPLKGGIGSIFHPPGFGKDYKWLYKWYFSCQLIGAIEVVSLNRFKASDLHDQQPG